MKIILCDQNTQVVDAYRRHCGSLPDVTVSLGSILDQGAQCVVSPANSFGFMDGGIDAFYTSAFGPAIEDRVRHNIRRWRHSELLVGESFIVPTFYESTPLLCVAPTMRVPMKLPSDTVNIYLAARAALLLCEEYGVESVAFPGMGTGVGGVKPDICALQMWAAISGDQTFPASWREATTRHAALYGASATNLQYAKPVV